MSMTLNLSSSPNSAPPRLDGPDGSLFHTLIYTVFQKPRDPELGGVVVAISSPSSSEGVTFISRALLQEIGKSGFNSVAGVNLGFLRKLHSPTLEAIRHSLRGGAQTPAMEPHALARRRNSFGADGRRGPWEGSWQYRRDCIDLLREEFDYSIIDCPALHESGDLLSIAPFVDGVLLVIEANRTRREEPIQAEQSIAAAGGKLLGFILNKRTDEMPSWLDRVL